MYRTAITSQRDVLSVLGKLKKGQRVAVLKGANKELIDAISELVLNTLHGNVKLNSKQKKKLFSHKSQLRKIASKNITWRKKRVLLTNQKGSGIFALLFPLITSVIGAITSAVKG